VVSVLCCRHDHSGMRVSVCLYLRPVNFSVYQYFAALMGTSVMHVPASASASGFASVFVSVSVSVSVCICICVCVCW